MKLTKAEKISIELAYSYMYDEYKRMKRSRTKYINKEYSCTWIIKKMKDFQRASKKLKLGFTFKEIE